VEEAALGFRLVAVDPVEIGGGKLVMRLDGPAMLRRLGERKLRLGSAFIIFLFFLRHLTGTFDVVSGRYQNVRSASGLRGIVLIQIVDPGE
jgi:hypothetical protein